MIRIPKYSQKLVPSQLNLSGAILLTRDSSAEPRHQWWAPGKSTADPRLLKENDDPQSPEIDLDGKTYSLRSGRDLKSFFEHLQIGTSGVVVDVTTLGYATWAILIKYCLLNSIKIRAAYAEPDDYSPPKLDSFQLSERVTGVRGIPSFLYLDSEIGEDAELVIFMGFEGNRASHVIRSLDVPEESVTPVIGLPGFVPEFTQYSFIGNRRLLDSVGRTQGKRYARANCPFAAIMVLDNLVKDAVGRSIKVALLGTRPHALGAVMYYLSSGRRIGLIYDFPIPMPGRTSGCRYVHLYDLSTFYVESRSFGF